MSTNMLNSYIDKYPNAQLTRNSEGVLTVTLHSDGDSLVFNGYVHTQLTSLFADIGNDTDNRCVILTGSGDYFIKEITGDGFDFSTPHGYDKIFTEGRRVLFNLLNIEVPVIAALNGPVNVHSEYILLCDFVLAHEDVYFRDVAHPAFKLPPNDGLNILWTHYIGEIRAKRFLLMNKKIKAKKGKKWGVVTELVDSEKVMQRAGELAVDLINNYPPLAAKYSKIGLSLHLGRLLNDNLGYSLALEGIAGFPDAENSK